MADGYEVSSDNLSSGGCDISITKGGLFKAVLGMRTALKVSLVPQEGNISFEAGVGIFGQQAIPTMISLFILWPVMITQIWGLIEQSKLDDKALEIAEGVIAAHSVNSAWSTESSTPAGKFCTVCGTRSQEGARFCSQCGAPL